MWILQLNINELKSPLDQSQSYSWIIVMSRDMLLMMVRLFISMLIYIPKKIKISRINCLRIFQFVLNITLNHLNENKYLAIKFNERNTWIDLVGEYWLVDIQIDLNKFNFNLLFLIRIFGIKYK